LFSNDKFAIQLPPDFAGKELVVGTPDEFERVRQAQRQEKKRARVVTTIEDLAAYVIRWGKQDDTVIFCSKDRIKAVLDENEPLQSVAFEVEPSAAFAQWRKALSNAFTQADFKEFVERRQADIVDGITLLNVVEDLKLTTTIEHDGKYDNEHNYSVMYKESTGGESAVKIPKHFTVLIPLSEGDPQAYSLKIELRLKKPRAADEKFLFSLKCHELEDILLDAMNNRIDKLKGMLTGWHIHAGNV
jgi:hypothetical protein